ncbi:hypothetical protein FBU30_002728 [Linnemannia zychae]|nr:hypothetical protein FBU30_002728 [Linnemannia zychae]
MDQGGLDIHHQNNRGSTNDITMTERVSDEHAPITTTNAASTSTSATTASTTGVVTKENDSTLSKDSVSKKAPGSGSVSITMDVYHQLQQQRLLERQQQESLKKQQQTQRQQTTDTLAMNGRPMHTYEQQQHQQLHGSQPPLETLEHIVSIVQATAPALSIVSPQTQQVPMPGPALASIIFGATPAAASSSTTASVGAKSDSNDGTGTSTAKIATATLSNGHSSSHSHRKGTGATGTQMHSQSQPRTSSPPTPASGSSSGAQKNAATKGPKAIHAIELIRIAGEILQFPPTTIGTSLVYYHKYRAYLHQAYKRGERDNEAFKADEYLFATACLHLACKCTEVSRKVRDLVNVTYRVMNPGQPALSLSTKANDATTDPSSSHPQQSQHTAPPPTAATFWHIRDSLLTTELMLLRILQFDLDVSLPFSDVLRIYKGMGMVFSPTDEEAANLYPYASNFDVFLPAEQSQQHQQPHSTSSSPNKHGAALTSSSSSSKPITPYTGIHPTLSALVQISTTFCIDALCNSNIALNSSSRALAMGSIYLAIRSAGLDLPLPFEEWCYAWGRPMIAAGFGIQGAGASGTGGIGMSSGIGSGMSSMNGIMGLTSGTSNLFVSSPRPASDSTSFMDGLEFSNNSSGSGSSNSGPGSSGVNSRPNGIAGRDSAYSQTHSPLPNSNSLPLSSPSTRTSSDNQHGSQESIHQQHMTIVDEVRKVVQELGNFYTH